MASLPHCKNQYHNNADDNNNENNNNDKNQYINNSGNKHNNHGSIEKSITHKQQQLKTLTGVTCAKKQKTLDHDNLGKVLPYFVKKILKILKKM